MQVSNPSKDIKLVLISVVFQANRNRLLDVARETYKENIGDIYQLNRMLSERHNLPFMMVYQDTGFVFALRKADLEGELPEGFVNVVLKKGRWIFSSMELVRLFFSGTSYLSATLEEDECAYEGCPRRDFDSK